MINLHAKPYQHFLVVMFLGWTNVFINHNHLVVGKPEAASAKRPFFVKPEGALLQLGIIAFCSMAAEGAMFDWSGVYFKEIVLAPASLVVLGYASFMVMMATGRFLGDWVIAKVGRKRTVRTSGFIISAGMATAVFFPYLLTATLGFMLVGIGVST